MRLTDDPEFFATMENCVSKAGRQRAMDALTSRNAMSLSTNVVQGTLKPDGTLELDEKPTLAPGRVHVTLQSVPTTALVKGGLAETIEEIRKYQQTHGYQGRTSEEMARDDEERKVGEDEYEQRMQRIWSQTQSGSGTGAD
jgi:hypothetical protein